MTEHETDPPTNEDTVEFGEPQDAEPIIPDATQTPRFTAREKTRKKPPPMPRGNVLRDQLADLYTTAGTLLFPFDNYCGNIIIKSAPECADKLQELARQNEDVRRVLLALTQTSAWGAVLASHAPIIMAVGAHHFPGLKQQFFDRMEESAEDAVTRMNSHDFQQERDKRNRGDVA